MAGWKHIPKESLAATLIAAHAASGQQQPADTAPSEKTSAPAASSEDELRKKYYDYFLRETDAGTRQKKLSMPFLRLLILGYHRTSNLYSRTHCSQKNF
jgi:hypothetical protein